jgi:hypothetical protein
MGIDNYYFNNIDGKLVNDNLWDFYLTSDNGGQSLPYAVNCNTLECTDGIISDNDLILWFDVSNSGTTTDGKVLTSLVEWTGVTITPSSGITLNDFGLCGVDNGRVTGLTDTITLTTGDTKVKLYPVTGSTYVYPWSYVTGTTVGSGCEMEESICTYGGFYQGFFKIDFEKPAPVSSTTVSTNQCGDSVTATTVSKGNPDAKVYDLMPTDYEKGWTMETWLLPNDSCGSTTGTTLNDLYSNNSGFFFYIGTRAEDKFWNVFSGESGYTTSTNIPLQPNIPVDEGLNGGQSWFTRSAYGFSYPWAFSNCCCNSTGSTTTEGITSGTSYNYCNEIGENALGFRITPEGKLGWRKLTVTGECRNNKEVITGTTMEEEYTTDSVIPTGNTASLLQVVYVEGTGSKFGLRTGVIKMYVNGRLVLKSKDFIGLRLRSLQTWSDKQQGVPYNISWGGGTQGLLESKTFNGPDPEDKSLLIEENFAGTFLGQLSQLRFYKRPLNILELRNNLYVECNRYCVRSTFGGSQIIQPGSSLCGECGSGNLPPYVNC